MDQYEMKRTGEISTKVPLSAGVVLLVALIFGVSSVAFASVVHLPPGTAASGAIPIGTGTGQAPTDQWSFVPFSDTSCGDPGTTAAIDFYPSSTSNKDRLLIYFLGGGGCDDYNSCFNMRFGQMAPGFIGIVPRLAGLTTDSPPTDVTVLRSDNAADGNLFTDWSKVFVQYCTGDYHMGNNVATYQDLNGGSHIIQHVGFGNVQKYLGRLTATFCSGAGCTMPPPRQIVVSGSSDGGYGAVWNFEQIRNRFRIADSNIQLIDDSGPYMRMPYWTQTLQTQMATNWFGTGVSAISPACANAGFNCDPRRGGQFNALLGDLHVRYPNLRASLISAMADAVISSDFSRQTYGPPDNQPPFAVSPCGSASLGDCLPYGFEGLQVWPTYKLHGYFCTEALPDYTGSEAAGFKTFEITSILTTSVGTFGPTYHQWLWKLPLNQVQAIDGTLLSDFLYDQVNGTGSAWTDHVYTSADASTMCAGRSF